MVVFTKVITSYDLFLVSSCIYERRKKKKRKKERKKKNKLVLSCARLRSNLALLGLFNQECQ
jgi:hypothetical protein